MSYEELLQTMVGKTIESVGTGENFHDDLTSIAIRFTNGDKIEIDSRGTNEGSSYIMVSE